MPVTTIGDGTALVTVIPNTAYQPAGFPVNGTNYLPFVSVANGNTTLPFAVNPANQQSPFATQAVNAVTFGIDSLQIDFI